MKNRTKSAGFSLGAALLFVGGIVEKLWLPDVGETIFIVFVGLGCVLAAIGAYYGLQANRVEEPPLFELN